MNAVEWLNRNAGAIQTGATVVLVVLTGIYVLLTRTVAAAARDQIRLVHDERERRMQASRRSLHHAAKRLLNELDRLPPKPSGSQQERAHAGWHSPQLADFIAYARDVPTVDEGRAMEAVSALSRMQRSIDQTKAVNPAHGRTYPDAETADWEADMGLARSVLDDIIRATQ